MFPCDHWVSLITFLGWESCEMSKCKFYTLYSMYSILFAFNYSYPWFGIMCPTSPCSTEFSAFFEHFFRFLKFLIIASQTVFCKYLMFVYIWHHDLCMTMITWILCIFSDCLGFYCMCKYYQILPNTVLFSPEMEEYIDMCICT